MVSCTIMIKLHKIHLPFDTCPACYWKGKMMKKKKKKKKKKIDDLFKRILPEQVVDSQTQFNALKAFILYKSSFQ